jgi:iron complex transport system ATP-binding protein
VSGLSATGISVDLGGRRVVDACSFAAKPNELVGLIGANGVGKSSLLRAVAQLIGHSGEAAWVGRPLAAMPPAERARTLAYLPQGQSIHWGVEVRHLVGLGRLPHLGPISRMTAADEAAIDSAMTRADVVGLTGKVATELSGGERSRVLMARALAVGAPLLLADEPTASLDPYHQLHTLELLRGLAADGMAVVAVLHDLGLAARFCTRVLLMHQGRIIADGPPGQVLTPANLALAYGVEAYSAEYDGQTLTLPWRRLD